jgi:DNA-binding NarL/FixJ family response regulator
VAPTGVGAAPVPSLNAAIHWLLDRLYEGIPLPEVPVTDKHISLSERNRHICTRYAAGETLDDIARDLGLSHQRVHQNIRRWC